MESTQFIKHAGILAKRIGLLSGNWTPDPDTDKAFLRLYKENFSGDTPEILQKDVDRLFNGMLNPTLPSAYKLRDAALASGLRVDQQVQKRIRDAEVVWQF